MEENYVTTRHLSFICAILVLTVILSVSTSVFYTCHKIDALKNEVEQIDVYRAAEPPIARPALYRIKEMNGKIAVLYPNGDVCETLDVIVAHLPKKDRELLASGFNVYSMAEFASVIEDYTG